MAANNTNLKNKLQSKASGAVKTKEKESSGMSKLLIQMSDQIAKALPSMISSERFQRVVLTAFNGNPQLQKCEPTSFLAAMMQSAQLGLEPNTPLGQAYLIPYKNKVQFQIGYKGLLELAQRSGQIKMLYAHTVHENDDFNIEYGLEQKLSHTPLLKGDRGETIGYYAVYHLKEGGYSFIYMTKDDVLNHAKSKSKTFYNGPWQTDFDEMAKKTVLKKLLKYAPISIELGNALTSDETVKNDIKEDMSEVVDESINVDFVEVNEADYTEVNEVTEEEEINDKEELEGQEQMNL